jgi:putative nucleotidyltransferase with HDIG domain
MAKEASSGRGSAAFWKAGSASRSDVEGWGGRLRPLWWALAYVLVTTAAYSPSLSFRGAAPRAGQIAARDVVAPRDLVVFDAEATERRRAEAAAEVPPVYDWDHEAPGRVERDLRDSFEKARQAMGRGRRRTVVTDEVRAAFSLPIGDEALRALAATGFSPAIEGRLIAIAASLYEGGILDDAGLARADRERGVLLRDVSSGRETRRQGLPGAVVFGADTKTIVAARLADAPFSESERSEVAAFLAAALRPNIVFNVSETARRREDAKGSVESVFARLPRGKVIVRRGDEITPRAAQWLAAVQASVSDVSSWLRVLGVLLVEALAAVVFWFDARRQRRRKRERSVYVTYGAVLSTGIVFAVVTRAAFALTQAVSPSIEGGAASGALNFAIPFAAGPIVAGLVAGMGPALLAVLVNAFGVGLLMGQSFLFALFAAAGALAGIFGLGRVHARSALMQMGGLVAAANILAIAASRLAGPEPPGFGALVDLAGGIAGGAVVAAVVGFTLPLFEQAFHVVTDLRLLELSNQNLPLLRNLALEAPGTYQHSLMLGHLAEAAADALGADALLARVSGYYHDIGKTKMPEYFIENQPKGRNRHDQLAPSMSALIIAAHVKEGVEMARKAGLPEPIVTAIREHHGTKLIRYFFQKALSRAEAGQPVVREIDYRYPGPKPSTRVLGILMIADAVEAASRTLIEPTPTRIRAMIRQIVDDCLRDGQFDNCDLTMRDLALIADSLERTVARMYHHRIDYPGFEFNRPMPQAASAAEGARGGGPRAVN